jgi:hypothetical protein
MHWTVDYSKFTNEDLKRKKAMDDVRFYLGKQYNHTVEVIKDEVKKGMGVQSIMINLELFLGIRGYPALVFAESFFDADKTPKSDAQHV